jgi:Na+/H+ antiporter NhaA
VIGKPLAVLLSPLLAVKARVGAIPDGMTLRHFIGVGFPCLAIQSRC